MTRKIKLPITLALAAMLLSISILPAFSAYTGEITVPIGQTGFSIELVVNESEPYAGIEFGLTLSDENAVKFVSFQQGGAISGASASPFTTVDGTHYFGFYRSSNVFSGENMVGTLHFTYAGDAEQTITLTHMMIVRIDEDDQPVGTKKDSPVAVYTVKREDSENNGNGGDEEDPENDDNVGSENGSGGTEPGTNPGNSGNPGQSSGGGSSGNPGIDIGDDDAPLTEYTGPKSRYFDDVPEELWPWAVDEIDNLYEAGVINGVAERLYAPQASITRGDFMLMLVRAYGLEANVSGNFPDVPQSSYYYDAIAIAKELGIAKGDGVNFAPQSFITRQDMMVLIDRTLREVGQPLPAAELSVLSSFADFAMISDYATDSVAILVQSGIIKGDGNGINPLGNTTRAEMAVVVYRILAA